jgi:hypothetical protein
LFAGISFNGAVIKQDEDATREVYGRMVDFKTILTGSVVTPQSAEAFIAAVRQAVGTDTAPPVPRSASTERPAAPVNPPPAARPTPSPEPTPATESAPATETAPTPTPTPPPAAAHRAEAKFDPAMLS